MKIKHLLISQPEPKDETSPFQDLANKYNVKITYRKFIKVEPVQSMDFLKERVRILDHSAVIMTSRTAIENFFRICKETKIDIPNEMKFFCLSEPYALYLQKFTSYRKRRIFFPKTKDRTLEELLLKNPHEYYFIPCSNISSNELFEFLDANGIRYSSSVLYNTVSADLSDIDIYSYDIIAFFSPAGINSLRENFPGFVQNDIRIAAFGESTCKAVVDAGLRLDIPAPTPQTPSMKMAIEQYIKNVNK
ncbi:MAG TPA: uroporphyrinogen-III synthase [Bacteroidia bacterium]|nr:uroporphyrinogen-III synthase [Sphingobacteriales bacterium]HPD64880.1 uroporphyrinogen-III synthase [Bacteroidia bacterium]HRS58404.1 uroporphyrinogen-III synthase [Bacteroidia bacterium]HRU67354.1 uroporphyrinogen-III synthase [Bacteroidia bacterium]